MEHMRLASDDRMLVSVNLSVPPTLAALQTAMLLLTGSTARAPAKAKEFALSMFARAARGLDVDQIEHWARIVTQLARLTLVLQSE